MKKWWSWMVVGVFALYVLGGLSAARNKTPYQLVEFGQLPVLLNGRVQPIDSMARNALLMIRGKQQVVTNLVPGVVYDTKSKIPAIQWLAEVLLDPATADTRRIFRVDHPDLQSLWQQPSNAGEDEFFSYNTLAPKIDEVMEQAQSMRVAERENPALEKQRTPYQKQVIKLADNLVLYQRLKVTLRPKGVVNFDTELKESIAALNTLRSQQAETGKMDPALFGAVTNFASNLDLSAAFAYALPVPPLERAEFRQGWNTLGSNVIATFSTGEIHPAVTFYAQMADGYQEGKPDDFNKAVAGYRNWLQQKAFTREISKSRWETRFNHYQPFIKSMAVYVAALVFALLFWVKMAPGLRTTAMRLAILALFVHTSGLIFRMVLEGRPPVTNLYSSAIFVGWGAVILGLILERIFKDGIGLVVSAVVGFVTLIIAHHLSLAGDTMEMLQAVLDTNIWLATHVVVITLGYSSMFVAGFLGIVYVVRGFLTRTLTDLQAKSLSRMVYGIICFATLFSFVGTILGGIWADQSWGRFWGWDPKENGALLIVLWNAIVLHARWGGMIRERGLMNMAIFGNVITAFSWFGVNMLGIGLHSYGFMDEAFYWLLAFIASQLVLMAMGMAPLRFWKSGPLGGGLPTAAKG